MATFLYLNQNHAVIIRRFNFLKLHKMNKCLLIKTETSKKANETPEACTMMQWWQLCNCYFFCPLNNLLYGVYGVVSL